MTDTDCARLNPEDRVYVAGHNGLVGSALVRRLEAGGYRKLIVRRSCELDLRRQGEIDAFFDNERPEIVFLAAARVGGIMANDTLRADFIRENLLVQSLVIDAALRHDVRRLLFLGSSCIYPRDCPQPIREDAFLTGPLEPTNRPYAIAKIAGIELCSACNAQHGTHYLSVMPTNLYGPGDNFDLASGHVLPALLRRFHEAKIRGDATVTLWGTGRPRREFMHVDDLADACVYLLEKTDTVEMINIGVGKDCTVRELAELVSDVVGFRGRIELDESKPDGMPRKLLDVSRLTALGWTARTGLREGITATYRWFQAHANTARGLR